MERESFHGSPWAVEHRSMVVPISDELLAEVRETQAALHRWMTATPEERAEWAEQQRQARAAERAATADRAPLTIDALVGKLGWSQAYAEHFVQPYCECFDGMDGWEYCQHARDEGVTP
jgi:hypothetical protein